MKGPRVAIVICIALSLSSELRLGLDSSYELLDSISDSVRQLLDNTYRTLHLINYANDAFSAMLIAKIAIKYEGPVEIGFGNYRKNNAAIIVMASQSVESVLINDLEDMHFLIVIVAISSEMEVLSTINTVLRRTKIIKTAVVSYDPLESIDVALVNISIITRFKTKNCENQQTLCSLLVRASEKISTAKNLSVQDSYIDFQGCTLEAGIVLMAPFTIIATNDGTISYSGVEVELIKALAEHFNFKSRFIRPPNNMQWGDLHENGSTGLMFMLQEGEVDLAIGSIARSLPRNTLLSAGVGNFYDQNVFALPPGIPYTHLQKLTMPVKTSGWIFIIIACIITSLLFSFDVDEHPCQIHFDKRKFSITDVYVILLGGGMNNPPGRIFNRYLLISWLMVTLVCRTAYQAILFGHLRCGVEFKPILDLKDIEEAGLKYYMYNVTQRFFVHNPRILSRLVIVNDNVLLQDVLRDIADNKLKAAFPLPKTNIAYFNKQRLFESKLHSSKYVVQNYEVAVHYPMGSPLPALFDDMILRIRAVGLHDYWARLICQIPVDNSVVPTQLNLENLLGAFVIHGILCSLGCLIFVFEIVADKVAVLKRILYRRNCLNRYRSKLLCT